MIGLDWIGLEQAKTNGQKRILLMASLHWARLGEARIG